ncbi:Peptidase A1 [Macrophomina phaseolina MS6]|uniref:Peptidase A1 n=1 Tax=Macrophomina phaseolina (strain MS6) TaxID=1126212 RepID=K2RBV4_MACPH|nr:Peptidase A1 [Macrophomina phaseolina MS6]
MFPLLFLPAIVAAAPAARQAQAPALLPLSYKYGGYPKISTDIIWGTPGQEPIETVYGPNGTINSGSPYLGGTGDCTENVTPFFNWPESSTATDYQDQLRGYAYGGNGKLITAPGHVNDTISFTNPKYPSLLNQQVQLVNFTRVKSRATTCNGSPYERSILGISEDTETNTGPSFRGDLLSTGRIESPTLSLWFNAPPASVLGEYKGTALFGALPSADKYAGPLVKVAQHPPEDSYVGYYVATPKFSVAGKEIPVNTTATPQCLIDSGFGTENLPIATPDFLNATGLIESNYYPAYPGPCESIPKDLTLDYTFAGVDGEEVTVKVPLRSYARGITDYYNETNVCGLSFSLEATASCALGAPFFTSAFLAFNDDTKEIAIAQGGVSSGAEDGVDGLGDITVVKRGAGLP